MTLNITSKQMDITPAIREHVEGRLAKLEKWHTQLISPHFVLSKVPNGFSVEASIGTPLGNLLATATADDMYKAINEVEEKLEKYNLANTTVEPQNPTTTKKFTKQHLMTDTGIELKIPMEEYNNKDRIEFITNSDGTISVLIKNIGCIESK